MTQLLVSVRSPDEAEAAVRGGAAIIDVKEPANGPLGKATDDCIAAIVQRVERRRPVSAALGEWSERDGIAPAHGGVSYLKWGFAGCGGTHATALAKAAVTLNRMRTERPGCGLVVVAYADWQAADAPTPDALCRFACEGRLGPFAVDTWKKDGSTLLDHLPLATIAALVARCRVAKVPVALAGSIGRIEMQTLLSLAPDWFAVRTAVCRSRNRLGPIDEDEVRRLVEWLNQSPRGKCNE